MSIIKNYGLRWVRDRVEWGRGRNAGKLDGVLASARRDDPVDFREQMGVYVLYEPGFIPVYIGQAGLKNQNLFDRLKTHKKNHLRDRWSHFSWFGFRGVNKNGGLAGWHRPGARTSMTYIEAMNEVEGILIHVLEPRLNKQGAKWREGAAEYVQAGRPAEADQLDAIAAKLDQLLDGRVSG